MNHPITKDSPQVTKDCVTESRHCKLPARWLAWAITLGEAMLWGTLAWFFADYWLMLPVRYRVGCILVLASLAALGLFRLVRFHRRLSRVKKADTKTLVPERRWD